MAGAFKPGSSLTRDQHDWGVFAQVSGPRDGLEGSSRSRRRSSRASATTSTGTPGQEEVIYVIEGSIEQWVLDEKQVLTAGDSVVIPASAVHASFNDGTEPAKILAILSPAVGDDGYGVEDVAGDEPWASLR